MWNNNIGENQMKVLVTGGSGFIGSHIVDRLLSDGNSVTVFDLWESEDVKAHQDNPNYKFTGYRRVVESSFRVS